MDTNPTSHLEDEVTSDADLGDIRDLSPLDNDAWLSRARSAYKTSTQWVDANLRPQWERSIKLFQSQHPSGSKYQSAAYKRRSRIFRPKTRSTIRRGEAAVAAAFFATHEVVSIRPNDDSSPIEVARARLWHEAMNYRLTRTIPWFRVCLGAYQDASVNGFCVSKQYWRYEEDEFGEVVADHPVMEVLPPENVRFDPGADWLDPITSSPYIIGLFPMYVGDVRTRIDRGEWLEVSDAALRNSGERDSDSTRQARERRHEDKYQDDKALLDHETCWVHENIFREAGRDWHFWSAGTQEMLSDPVPLETIYVHGERPYVMGYGVLEAHRAYPASRVELTQDLQTEANDIANLRLDNVKLTLMPMTKVRQGVGVDIAGLVNRVPGKVIATPNPETDIVEDRPPDVTGSAFAEQDRINVDFDELAGAFSTSSVASNRKLNETVGGMAMLSQSASAIMEYDLRVFAETWVEPALRQILLLEQAYETDDVVMALAAKEARVVWPLPREVIEGEVNLEVNVGVGATNPMEQLTKFQMGVDLIGKIFGPAAAARAKFDEVVTEVFGKLGYKDGLRFFAIPDDPAYTHLTAQMEQMQKALQANMPDLENKHKIAQLQAQTDIAEQEMDDKTKILLKRMDLMMEQMRQQAAQQATAQQATIDLALQRDETYGQGMIDLERERMKGRPSAQGGSSQGGGGASKPMQDMMSAMVGAMQGMSEAANLLAAAAQQMSGPKEIVRDERGRPVGVRPAA